VIDGIKSNLFLISLIWLHCSSSSRCSTLQKEELVNQKPRGAINLHCANVAPSEEDSVTFTIYAANGEVYKLRGE